MIKISIITVVFNDKDNILKTIENVSLQTYKNIEYIVVDGNSTDGTKNIILNNINKISKYISEPDLGIYHAMNKGVKIATGDWLLFLNSGDKIFENTTIEEIFSRNVNEIDIIYGDVIIEKFHYSYLQKSLGISKITTRMICCHQSMIIKRQLLLDYPYNLKYKIVADYEFSLINYIRNKNFLQVNQTISIFAGGGVSSRNRVKRDLEIIQLLYRNRVLNTIGQYTWVLSSLIKSILINFFSKTSIVHFIEFINFNIKSRNKNVFKK